MCEDSTFDADFFNFLERSILISFQASLYMVPSLGICKGAVTSVSLVISCRYQLILPKKLRSNFKVVSTFVSVKL